MTTYRLFVSPMWCLGVVVGALLLRLAVMINSDLEKRPEHWLSWRLWGSGANLNLTPLKYWWLAIVYLPALMIAVPLLALSEEYLFRALVGSWALVVPVSGVLFGAVH